MLQLYRSSIYSSTVTLKILKSNTELATQTKALEEVEVYDHNLNKSLLFECWATEGTIVLVLNRLCLLWAQMWNTRLKLFPKYFSKKKKKLTYSLLFQILLACKNQTGVTQNIHVTSDLLKHTQLCTTFRIVLTLQIQTESTDLTVPAS